MKQVTLLLEDSQVELLYTVSVAMVQLEEQTIETMTPTGELMDYISTRLMDVMEEDMYHRCCDKADQITRACTNEDSVNALMFVDSIKGLAEDIKKL